MTVQLDIDGTLDFASQFLGWLSRALRAGGHRVLVVSSRIESAACRTATRRELKGWGVECDELLLTPAHLPRESLPADLQRGHELFIYKVLAAQAQGVDVLVDDCGITVELFRRHLPGVKVFRPQSK